MLNPIFQPIFRSVFSSPFVGEPLPSFELKDGTLKPRASGSSTATFTRATTAQGVDHDGRSYLCAAGVPRQDGYYTVVNLITASEDMTNGAYAVASGAVVDSATQITMDGTANGRVSQTVTIADDGSGALGRTFTLSFTVALLSGSAGTGNQTQILIQGDAVTQETLGIGPLITSTPQRFSITASTDAAGTGIIAQFRSDKAATFSVTDWQLEEVTGQLNQNPGPYVSTGVGTGSELFTDANAASISNETDATTGFVAGLSGLLTSETEADGDSAYSIQLDADGNAGGRLTVDLDAQYGLVDGKDYVLEIRGRSVSGDSAVCRLASTTTGTDYTVVTWSSTSFATTIHPFRHAADTQYLIVRENGASDDAVFRISSISIKEADHGSNIDGIKRFPYLNGNTVSSGLVTEANGPRISGKTCKYGVFDGVAGSYVSSPDSAAGSVTGDLTLIWNGTQDVTAADALMSKYKAAGNLRSYFFRINANKTLSFIYSADGSAATTVSTTSLSSLTYGEMIWFRVSANSVTGDFDFYESKQPRGTVTSALNWELIESVSGSAFSLDDNAHPVEIGSSDGGLNNLTGKVARALVIASTDPTATPALDYNANDWTAGQTFESSTTSEVWTINGNVGIYGPLSKWVDLDGGSGAYISTPDTAAASVLSDITIVAYGAADDWSNTSNGTIVSKWMGTGNQRSYRFEINTDGTLFLGLSNNGVASITPISTAATGFADATPHWVRATWDDTADLLTFYTSTDPYGTPYHLISWVQLGDAVSAVSSGIFDSTAGIGIGALNAGTGDIYAGKVMRAAVIASTDPTVAPSVDFDARSHESGTTMTCPDGAVYTLNGDAVVEGGKFPVAPFKTDGTQEPLGYLPETAGTNAAFYSNALDNAAWSKSGCTVDANAARASDGTLTASRINVTANANLHGVNDTQLTNTSGRNVSFTAELKNDGERYVYLNLTTSAEDHITAVFDLTDGVITATDAGTTSGTIVLTKMVAMNDGWFRCTLVGSIAEASALLWMIGSAGSAVPTFDTFGRVSFTPSAGEDFFATRVNVEDNASFPTSYISTTSAAVTRNKDELSYASAGNAKFPMTVMMDYTPGNDDAQGILSQIDDGSANERIQQATSPGSYSTRTYVRNTAGTTANFNGGGAPIAGMTFATASVAATDNVEGYVDGASYGTDTSAAMPTGLTTIRIGMDNANAVQPHGHINNVRVYPKVLNADEIKAASQQ